ncbi:hypothetical protein PITCH_A400017 [uncultured Desulfobacterium sp.]|uniref:Uncharacterized protein n=1 Tax=uncultured Desulfobacterium sp. TaxID=201089 RepID=A0A445N039_9BACT|nr:hypothetical protein PITCH_A400017 [uncultured Desulfobacterium sp.]
MDRRVKVLRNKMQRYNEWEADNRRMLPIENRLEQFAALYDLKNMYADETVNQLHEEHLNSLINITGRLKKYNLMIRPGQQNVNVCPCMSVADPARIL